MNAITQRFIEDAGNLAQSLGFGRVVGQIYGLLYFSEEPVCLNDMTEELGISKGSASMCVRQLEQWGAVRKVWVKGDRRDYYEANDWFGRILKNIISDIVAKHSNGRDDFFSHAEKAMGDLPDEEQAFAAEQVKKLAAFQEKVMALVDNPLVRMLLK